MREVRKVAVVRVLSDLSAAPALLIDDLSEDRLEANMAILLFLPLEMDSNTSSTRLLVLVNRVINDFSAMGIDLSIRSFTPMTGAADEGILVDIAGHDGWHLEHQLALNQQGLRCQAYP